MKATLVVPVIEFALKRLVKFLKSHPDLIPGKVDDVIIGLLAGALGV